MRRPTNRAARRALLPLAALLGFAAWVGAEPAKTPTVEALYASCERTVAPGEPAVVRVRTEPAAVPATIRLFRVPSAQRLLDAGLDLRDGAAVRARLWPSVPGARAPAAVFVRESTLAAARPPAAGRPAVAEADVLLPESGLYVAEVSAGGLTTAVVLQATRLVLVTKRDAASVLAWAVDRTTGRPVEGVAVEARGGDGPLATATTDARGLARLAVPADRPAVEVRGALGDDLVWGSDTWFASEGDDRRVYVFAHQPAYRPGERVEVKGIVRRRVAGRYELDADATVASVRLVPPQGAPTPAVEAAVSNDLGTFAAGFDLAETATTGDWRIEAELGGRVHSTPLRVEAYRVPTFEVSVRPDRERVLAGGEVRFTVAAAFFEGGPLANADVEWSVAFHRVDRDLFPQDELARLFFGQEREAYAPVVVRTGTARLDGEGRLWLPVAAPLEREDGFLSLSATVVGPDRTVAAGRGTAGVSASPLRLAVKTDRHVYGAEGTAAVTVRAVLADGAPAAGRDVSLLVTRAVDAPGGWREEVAEGARSAPTDARGVATFEVPLAGAGRFALTAAARRLATEPAGEPATSTVHVWVAGEHADVGVGGDRLELVPDRDAYAVGDVARVLVVSPIGARPCLATVEGPRIASERLVSLGGRADGAALATFDVAIEDAHAPDVFVGVVVVDHGNVLARTTMLRVPPVKRLLRPVVTTDRAEYAPGATMAASVRVEDSTGAPVAGAEVAVAVVDEALHSLHADPGAAIEPFFVPVRRNDVRTGAAAHLRSLGWAYAPAPTLERSRDGRAIPVTGGAPAAPTPARQPPGSPAPAPSERAPAADPSRPGDRPQGDGAAEAHGPTPSRQDRGGDFRGLGGEEPGTLVDLDDVTNGLEGRRGTEGPLAAREDFRSAVAWSPTLRTGADGVAPLPPVRLAQSLTRWRLTARAVDAATRVGSSTTTVRTALALSTRVTLPRFLRAGDVVRAPWVLQNHRDAPVDVAFVASATGLALAPPASGSATVGANGVAVREVTLTSQGVGPAEVRTEVRGGDGADASLAKLPVLPQGIDKALSVSRLVTPSDGALPALSLPPHAERGSASLAVRLTPSVAQAVGAALPYLADYPHGCTEQTMSRLVPVVVAKVATDAFHAPLTGRLADLPKMLSAGLARLRELQHDDGGFGWWEKDATDPYMTAYVLHGLSRALPLVADATQKAAATATARRAGDRLLAWRSGPAALDAPGHLHAFVTMALADAGRLVAKDLGPAVGDGITSTGSLERAFLLRAAIAAKVPADDVAVHAASLANRARRDAAGARWDDAIGADAKPLRREDDAVETTAWALGALLAADATHPLLEPGARWLLAQRRGDAWRSTRDTAAAVAFLARYAAATNDAGVGRRAVVSLNGVHVGTVEVTNANVFTDAAVLRVGAAALPAGPLVVTVRVEGAPLLADATLAFTETGPAIDAASAGFDVRRSWWRVEPRAAADRVEYARTPFTETVPSGTEILVEVEVTTREAREFVRVTSPLAAGFEPRRDAEGAIEGLAAAREPDHVDRRDDRVVFFVRSMPAGTHVFRHRARAVHVGSFTALPAQAELMYFPDVRGNAQGEVIEVSAAGGAGAVSPEKAGGR